MNRPVPIRSLSVVVPTFNEVDNIELVHSEVRAVMDAAHLVYELIFVDDGSTDGSTEVIRSLAANHQEVKAVILRKNYGQTAAMHAGIQHSSGDVIATMDGDLQNDPADIPQMLAKVNEGYDFVFGWRKNRKDKFLSRKLPSMLANKLISSSTGFPINDLGCTLKLTRSEIAKDFELYGDMHRFIPILASNLGAKCLEVEVNHRPRIHGQSKYGLGRWVPVLLDLITIQYMTRFFNSPMKLFGLIGFIVGFLSIIAMITTVVMKIGLGSDLTGNPITYFAIVSAILSVQFLSLGLFGELAVRIYYGSGDKQSYKVREKLNFSEFQKSQRSVYSADHELEA